MEFPGHPYGTRFTDADEYLRSSFRRFSYGQDDVTPRAEAFARVTHPRLGVDSPLSILPYDLFRHIGISSFAEGREIREDERVAAESMRIATELGKEAERQWDDYKRRNVHYRDGVTTPSDVYLARTFYVEQLRREFGALERSSGYDRQGVSVAVDQALWGTDTHVAPRTTLKDAMEARDFDPNFA